MVTRALSIPTEQIAGLCRCNGIRRLFFFGSVLTPQFGPESDIDILVEFEPGHQQGFRFYDIEESLCSILGRQVDLHTYASLSHYFRDDLNKVLVYDAC